MKKSLLSFVLFICVFFLIGTAQAAYDSTYDAVNFKPAIDAGDYYTVYGSQSLKPGQGDLGFYLDYANRPLEFRGTNGTTGRQSVLDGMATADLYGALGLTNWFLVGVNVPFVGYNWFYTADVNADKDFGSGMGDMMVVTKFRLVDIDKHKIGFALAPYVTFPTGDTVRYDGTGHIMVGGTLIVDFRPVSRFSASLNAGYLMRDDVTIDYVFPGGATSSIFMDDLFKFGGAMNYRFTKNFQGIVEAQGSTVASDFFQTSNTTSLEAGAGLRYYLGETGLSMDLHGTMGLIEGVGTPRYRAVAGLRWISPGPKECPKEPPAPYQTGEKIVLWGKIFFDTAKAVLLPMSFPVLDSVVEVMQTHPEIIQVEVQGHTDWRGGDAYNLKLSDARANSAMQYLVSKGVSPERLRAQGYGETKPIATNDTVEGMSQNRRVDFVIINSTAGFKTPDATTTLPADATTSSSGTIVAQ